MIQVANAIIFVINVGGYIGNSTSSEIEYAQARGKVVKYLEETTEVSDDTILDISNKLIAKNLESYSVLAK